MTGITARNRFAGAALLLALTSLGTGCATGPKFVDPFNVPDCENECTTGTCGACGRPQASCGCCEEPERWSSEWYAIKAGEPVGARQRFRCGKLWPPYPRPTGHRQQFTQTYHAAHYWPLPYICDDRAYVKTIVDNQVANGWATETTLYEYHFDLDTQLLTPAGHRHLQWILQEAPPERRVVFVQADLDEGISDARLENVRTVAGQFVGEPNCPAIVLRTTRPVGTPAEYVDTIQRAIRESVPAPRIQYQALPTGSGAGS